MVKLDKKTLDIIDNIIEIITDNSNKTFLIASHIAPDGDNVGSSMAIYKVLKKLGKNVIPYNPDDIPKHYSFLYGTDHYQKVLDSDQKFDVAIVVDNSDIERIGKDWNKENYKTIIQIDHHKNADIFGDIVYIDENASAVGEMIYFILERAKNISIDSDISTCLYTSIVTDTGSFRYSNTTYKTFYAASKLVEYGAIPWKINLEVYENVPIEKIKLLPSVLSTLKFNDDQSVAIMYLTKEMLDHSNATKDMAEGFVNYGRVITGVEISCILKEIGENSYKISLRSKKFDVSEVAHKYFSGGGHKNASGGKIEGNLTELIPDIENLLTKLIKGEQIEN